MKGKKVLQIVVLSVILIGAASSGWIFNVIKDRERATDKERAMLQASFNKQYGTDGITITQIVSPDKVYAASWTSKDGADHISWNIGGVWVTVFSGQPVPPTTATPETP